MATKDSKKSLFHLGKTTADALSLMKTKVIDHNHTPLFYAKLLFLKGFVCVSFNDAFGAVTQEDLESGQNNSEYTSYKCVEHSYVMRK